VRPATIGSVRRRAELGTSFKSATNDVETIDASLDIIFHYVGHNDGATKEWLAEVVPVYDDFSEPSETIAACGRAAGMKPPPPAPPGVAPTGEAKGP
jgi:hypothetical protein